LHNTNAPLGSGGQIHFTATGKVSAPGQPDKQKTVTLDVPLTICPWGDFDLTFEQPPPYTLYRTAGLSVGFDVTRKGEWNDPPQITVQFSNVPSGVTATYERPVGYIPHRIGLGAGPDAALGSSTFTFTAEAFLNGAWKSHPYTLPLTVVDGFKLGIEAASPTVVRGGPGTTITVTVERLLSFSGEVSVSFCSNANAGLPGAALPPGISVSPSPAVIAAGQVSRDFTVNAGCDAALSSFDIYPYATGNLGGAADCSFRVVDQFSLTIVPDSLTLISDGGWQDLTAAVTSPCYAQFPQPVVAVLTLPPGVSAYPGTRLEFAPGTTTAKFQVCAAKGTPNGKAQLTARASTRFVWDGPAVFSEAACNLDIQDSPYCCKFSLDRIEIRNTRSFHDDTDVVIVSMQIDDRKLPVFIKELADVNNGIHPVNLEICPAIAIGPQSKVIITYQVLNYSGSVNTSFVQGTSLVASILKEIATKTIEKLADQIQVGTQFILKDMPLAGVLITAVSELLTAATTKCDGVVATDIIGIIGDDVHALTQNGAYSETRYYPGRLDPTSDVYKQLYTPPSAICRLSDYSVQWSIARDWLPSAPDLSPTGRQYTRHPYGTAGTMRSPSAAAGYDPNGDYLLRILMADRYGCVWEGRYRNGMWKYFVNCGAPPGAVAVGSPRAAAGASGYFGVFVIGDNGTLNEAHPSGGSWSWAEPSPPTTDAADRCLSVVAGPASTGYMGVFVIGRSGGLWERRFMHQQCQGWISHGTPPGAPAMAPAAIVDNSGKVRVFVTATNGRVYECRPDGDPHWVDHGNPPGSSAGGSFVINDYSSPSFVATPTGYIGGLVLGENWHIYELSSTDSINFAWVDHGTPPKTHEKDSDSIYFIGASPGSPSLIAAPDGYLGALLLGVNADLNELYRGDDGSWKWISIGKPGIWSPSTGMTFPGPVPSILPPGTDWIVPTDPSYIATPTGYRGAFVGGSNGRLYEVSRGGGGQWVWTDHGI
jgi:hypothetical protein